MKIVTQVDRQKGRSQAEHNVFLKNGQKHKVQLCSRAELLFWHSKKKSEDLVKILDHATDLPRFIAILLAPNISFNFNDVEQTR